MINEITQGIKREIVAVSIREHLLKTLPEAQPTQKLTP